MKVLLAKTLILIIGLLPLGLARALGAFIGELNYLLNSKGAQVAVTNIRLCFPELSAGQQQRLVRASMREWGKTFFETPVVWQRSEDWLRRHIVHSTNQQLMDRCLSGDKGIIMIAPHLGNWEALGLHIAKIIQMTCLYQPPRQQELEALVKKARSRSGTKLAPTNRRGVIALVKALREGELTGILPDQVPQQGAGVFAPFFGVPTLTMTLLQNLLKSTGATPIVAAAKRVPGGFEIIYMEPDQQIYAEDPVVAASALNRCVEQIVRLFPEQYQWEYKRFKKRPEGEPKVY